MYSDFYDLCGDFFMTPETQVILLGCSSLGSLSRCYHSTNGEGFEGSSESARSKKRRLGGDKSYHGNSPKTHLRSPTGAQVAAGRQTPCFLRSGSLLGRVQLRPVCPTATAPLTRPQPCINIYWGREAARFWH